VEHDSHLWPGVLSSCYVLLSRHADELSAVDAEDLIGVLVHHGGPVIGEHHARPPRLGLRDDFTEHRVRLDVEARPRFVQYQ
jgi:hypothetical protein